MSQDFQSNQYTTLISDEHNPFASSRISTEDCTLVVISGKHKGMEVPLDREIMYIGRESWCDVPLTQDGLVSKLHCELRLDEKGVRIRDLGSRNGILHKRKCQVLEGYLSPGVQLKIGDSVLELRTEKKQREIEINYKDASGKLVGKGPRMRKIFSMVERLSKSETPILLTGETGTGKSAIAEAIHLQSNRKKGNFVHINCGGFPADLVEAELFGYEKSAFTGATQQRRGLFEQADGGTLFLDEIGEMPLKLQPKLLTALDRRRIRRLGSNQEIKVDVRFLAATNRDLQEEIKGGRFREDLYWRIAVVPIEVPPLRERRDDIPLLIRLTLDRLKRQEVTLSPETLEKLQRYFWPGNVRQLYNVLEGACATYEGEMVQVSDLHLPQYEEEDAPQTSSKTSPKASLPPAAPSIPGTSGEQRPLKDILEETEKYYIINALNETDWSVAKAAKTLEITKGWLYNRIRKYGLKKD